MTQWNCRKTNTVGVALFGDHKRGCAFVSTCFLETHFVRERRNLLQQITHFSAGGAVVKRGDQTDRLAQVLQVGLQLGFQGGIEHGVVSVLKVRSCQPSPRMG